ATEWLASLNAQQRQAVCHGEPGPDGVDAEPLLVVAGAGTGKTATLCHRVAWLVQNQVPADRIGLFTFSRRAASEMVRRTGELLAMQLGEAGIGVSSQSPQLNLPWAGTFHSVSARLLRQHASLLGLNPAFSIIDRSDATDLIGWIRDRHGLSKHHKRFPGASTCLNIYSDKVNCSEPLADVLAARFPWCVEFEPGLRDLFSAYVDRKLSDALLDYDDLLLWWCHGLKVEAFASQARQHFDHILIDEFQDCNALQMAVLLGLRPGGKGIFAVGDDAQSIYSFRAARVEFMVEFPGHFDPPARTVTLHQNYRSSQAVLDSANALMASADGPYKKNLVAASAVVGSMPTLAIVADDAGQSDYVINQILLDREAGVSLKQQAVLFRSAHHSDVLELALARRNIPYVKHGGLKFIEAAHVRDYLAVLRWSQNPSHQLAAFRALQLLPGVGPVLARRIVNEISPSTDFSELPAEQSKRVGIPLFKSLARCCAPAESVVLWPGFCELMNLLADDSAKWSAKLDRANLFIEPLIEQRYEHSAGRIADLQVLNAIAHRAGSARQFLSDMALDPPNATGDWSEDAHLDEDYLILSTVHSAKGQEWKNVFVLNVADGNFPNEYATGNRQAIEEERRLLYVAMTRAKQKLCLVEPQRYYITHQPKLGGAHVYGVRSRFLDAAVINSLNQVCPVAQAAAPTDENSQRSGLESGNTVQESEVSASKTAAQESFVTDSLRRLF
ncbi:MAG: ATP-dependent helicase, partial [Burkholderiaceae bacterium]